MPCSRNNNVGASDNHEPGCDYESTTDDDIHPANHHNTRVFDLHTTCYDKYTCSDDHDRRLNYDASRHHHNAAPHHNFDARFVPSPSSLRFLISCYVRHRRRTTKLECCDERLYASQTVTVVYMTRHGQQKLAAIRNVFLSVLR